MSQFTAGGLTTAVPTAARGPAIYATAAKRPRVLEVDVFSTVVTPVYVALQRATAVGTKGAAAAAIPADDPAAAALCPVTTTHTADATITAGFIRYARLVGDGAAVMWTFPDPGIVVDSLTTAGLVITCPSGTGQQIVFGFHWEE